LRRGKIKANKKEQYYLSEFPEFPGEKRYLFLKV